MMKIKQPTFVAVIPYIAPTADLFRRALASDMFTTDLAAEAATVPQKYLHVTRETTPFTTDSGYLVDLWAKPKDQTADNGITVLSQIRPGEGIFPNRLYVSEKNQGFMLLYSMSCCSGHAINAVIIYPTQTGLAVAHKSSPAAMGNMGQLFKGGTFVAGPEQMKNIDHLWAHVRGTQHACHTPPKFDTATLDRGSAPRPS